MRKSLLLALVLCQPALCAENDRTLRVVMGDGAVRGAVIGNHQASWRQCALQDGQWVEGGVVTETTTVIGNVLRHRQQTRQPDGIHATTDTYLDRRSLSPLRIEQEVYDAEGKDLARSERMLSATGYSGWVRRGGETKPVEGSLNSNYFNGASLGMPLSTLDFAHRRYELDAFMMVFDAHYRVFASDAGQETLEHDGQTLPARMVDVEWHHDNGDVYPPGPDQSGGRFWLLVGPHESLPRVLRYQTDSYAVEAVPGVCPE